MARTVSFEEFLAAIYECCSARGSERWADSSGYPVVYEQGIRPTAECYPEAEVTVNTYIEETFSEMTPEPPVE